VNNRRPASADFSKFSVVLYPVPHQNQNTLAEPPLLMLAVYIGFQISSS
jgi:hypothetical protein